MATLDWVLGIMLLGSTLIGAWRGLVFELLSVLGWIVAFFAAPWAAQEVAGWLPLELLGPIDLDSPLRYAAGFVVAFILTVFVWGFLAWIVKHFIEAVGLRPADRALGALFGILRALVLALAMTAVAHWTSLHQQNWWQQSQAAPVLVQLLQQLRPALPEVFGRHLPL